MQRKNIYIMLGVGVCIIALAGIAAYFLMRNSTPSSPTSMMQSGSNPAQSAQAIPTIMPQDIGLTLTPTRNNQALLVSVTKISDISLIDYELDYNAQVNGNTVPRGVIGKIQVTPGESKAQQEIVLGTCSDVCHYDTGVSDIQLTLKITKTDGTVSSLVTTASLP